MLRLKKGNVSINPANIECITVFEKRVYIRMINELADSIIDLETENDAIRFAVYVELLVDISNEGRTDIRNEAVRIFESYFKDFLRPLTLKSVVDGIKKRLN